MKSIKIKDWHRSNNDFLVCYILFFSAIGFLFVLFEDDIYPENVEIKCAFLIAIAVCCACWYLFYIRKQMKKAEYVVFRVDWYGIYFVNEGFNPVTIGWNEIRKIQLSQYDGWEEFVRIYTKDGKSFIFDKRLYVKTTNINFWVLKKAFRYFSKNKPIEVERINELFPDKIYRNKRRKSKCNS